MVTAKDIMNSNTITISPDATMMDAIETLTTHKISGAPVVEDSRVVGIISELGLFDVLFDPALKTAPVRDFMSDEVYTVDESESLTHVAHMFALLGIRRLPVLNKGKIVGVVSRPDLLRYALTADEALQEPLSELMPFLDEEMLRA